MMEQLTQAWTRRPRLSRGWKTVRNLFFTALLLLYFWGVAGYPLPTREMERERAWRQNLLPAGEVVMEAETVTDPQVATLDPEGITLGVDGAWYGWDILRYHRQGDVMVVPLPQLVRAETENRQIIFINGMLAVGLPADTRTVWMDLTLDWGLGSRTWKALKGEKQRDGVYLFLYNQDEFPPVSDQEEELKRNSWRDQLRYGEVSAGWVMELRREDGSVETCSGQTAKNIWYED